METFEDMLDDLYNNLDLKKSNPRIVLPEPILIKSGHKTIWKNPNEFLVIFNRNQNDLSNFINSETNATINWISESVLDGCIFSSKVKKDYIYELFKKYVNERVICKSCKSLDTILERNQELRKYNFKCNNCNNELIL
jgi:translation initiation factor 2 subunit 2